MHISYAYNHIEILSGWNHKDQHPGHLLIISYRMDQILNMSDLIRSKPSLVRPDPGHNSHH